MPSRILRVVSSNAANALAGQIFTCDIYLDPNTSVKSLTVPSGQTWIIEDVFIKDTADVGTDGTIIFVKNEDRVLARVGPASTLLVSNPSRPKAPKMGYRPLERLAIQYQIETSVGTAATTSVFYVKVRY